MVFHRCVHTASYAPDLIVPLSRAGLDAKPLIRERPLFAAAECSTHYLRRLALPQPSLTTSCLRQSTRTPEAHTSPRVYQQQQQVLAVEQSSEDTAAIMDKFRAFTNTIGSTVTPFATRSQQWIKEQTGNAGEKTELPHDYVELETRIDALKQTHQRLLAATSQYANEAYDYPPNVKESFQDLGKSISEKVIYSLEYTMWRRS